MIIHNYVISEVASHRYITCFIYTCTEGIYIKMKRLFVEENEIILLKTF
jgi:hypothetical protein